MRRQLTPGLLTVAVILLVSCAGSNETAPQSNQRIKLSNAEALVDAFYSYDQTSLESFLMFAGASAPSIVYYQGWAAGGNYRIIDRKPCEMKEANVISCSIIVEDDPMLALGIDFHVTDTFTITFTNNNITSVETSSNDLPLYFEAADWVKKELPDLVREPCQGFFDGGTTPGECARAMSEGYARFAASDNFPGLEGP